MYCHRSTLGSTNEKICGPCAPPRLNTRPSAEASRAVSLPLRTLFSPHDPGSRLRIGGLGKGGRRRGGWSAAAVRLASAVTPRRKTSERNPSNAISDAEAWIGSQVTSAHGCQPGFVWMRLFLRIHSADTPGRV